MKGRSTRGKEEDRISLKLYVAGMSEKSMNAIKNVSRLVEEYLKDCCDLEIIDLYKRPEAAQENQIVFSPSLIKIHPLPRKVMIGSFKDTDKLKKVLGIPLT